MESQPGQSAIKELEGLNYQISRNGGEIVIRVLSGAGKTRVFEGRGMTQSMALQAVLEDMKSVK